jgi:putative nucleotidyltransferase with HDIG domain
MMMSGTGVTSTSELFFPQALQNDVFALLKKAGEEIGLPVYVIGGFVRDFFLGKACKDIDIVTVGSGIQLAEAFARIAGASDVVVYENFGTALVNVADYQIEFVGARRESYRKDSRKPIVENGTLEDDQLRRDFTINALSLSLNEGDFGRLFDPFGGILDLEQKIIRTPLEPDITFSDDPLRMMRAIRFATTLQFYIEDETFASIKRQRERIKIISVERITEELNKIMLAKVPSQGYHLLLKTGLIELIFPEFYRMYGVEVFNNIGHKDNYYHTIKVLDNIAPFTDNLWLRWAALLHDIGKPATKRFDNQNGWTFQGHEERGARMIPGIFQRLRLPQHDKMRYVQKLVRLHQRPIALVDTEVTDSAIRRLIFEAGEDLEDLLTLCRADITTRDANKMARFLANYDELEKRIQAVEERDRIRNWQPPITGEIIMETFGIPPGPLVGTIKTAVREAILDGIITGDYDQAYKLMLKIGVENGLKPS